MGAPVVIRRASAADYPAFTRLFPQLGVDEPLPGADAWASAYVPFTLIAAEGADVLGYCYTQELDDTGYVRNVVVAPSARRRGVARALMEATAWHLRAQGKAYWRLNVGPRNAAALALYESLGLRTLYASRALRVPWQSATSLPASRAQVHGLPPARDEELEREFALPRGQLAHARGVGRLVLAAAPSDDARSLGLAVFSPAFPGAFPFRAREDAAVRSLVEAMHTHVPACPHVNLVIDDDEPLVRLLVAAGAEVRGDFLHLAAPLADLPGSSSA
ncbi:MAG TPA: GNAT family N-acetyltransferase [Polyangia bacterium]|nr:GNAT family N-acetyltransferase [Polyangia bacterium]